jgi:hypothetical protein
MLFIVRFFSFDIFKYTEVVNTSLYSTVVLYYDRISQQIIGFQIDHEFRLWSPVAKNSSPSQIVSTN